MGGTKSSAAAVGLIVGLTGCARLATRYLFGSDWEGVYGAPMLVLGIAISLVYNWCILWKLDDERG